MIGTIDFKIIYIYDYGIYDIVNLYILNNINIKNDFMLMP